MDHAAAAIGATMYIFGGQPISSPPVNDLWSIALGGQDNVWVQVCDCGTNSSLAPQRRSYPMMASIGSSLYIFGGSDNGLLNDLWTITPGPGGALGSGWTQLCANGDNGCSPQPPARCESPGGMTTIGNTLYIFGGAALNGRGTIEVVNDLWQYGKLACLVRNAVHSIPAALVCFSSHQANARSNADSRPDDRSANSSTDNAATDGRSDGRSVFSAYLLSDSSSDHRYAVADNKADTPADR